jgi:TPP-dependent pyruvate/acetoin dehydrogenase alpha subunit
LKEVNNWKKKDPLIFAKNFLIKKNLFKKEKLDSLDKNIFKNINVDFSQILNLKKPKFNRIKNLVYKK